VNCAETIQDRLGHPAYEMFGIKRGFQRKWLQIDTDVLCIITSTADELSGSTNIDDLERQKYGFKVNFSLF